MSRSPRAQEYVDWKEGAVVFAAMAVTAVLGAAGLSLLDVPYGWLIGSVVGALVVFLGYSYVRYA